MYHGHSDSQAWVQLPQTMPSPSGQGACATLSGDVLAVTWGYPRPGEHADNPRNHASKATMLYQGWEWVDGPEMPTAK